MQTIRIKHNFFVNMKLILLSLIFLLALGMTVFSKKSIAAMPEIFAQPAQGTPAFKQYQAQPKSEMSKVNYLFNRLSKTTAKVIYDGHEYEMREALKLARGYFYKHYRKESAEYWIQNYCYKTESGNVIFFKLADGTKVPVRDAALMELNGLEKIN